MFRISRVVFSVYKAMWRIMNLYQRGVTLWHDYLLLAALSCGHAAITLVVCRAVLQQVVATDGHQPFVSHFSLTCPFIRHHCAETRLLR